MISQFGTIVLRRRDVSQAFLYLYRIGKAAPRVDAKCLMYAQRLNMSSGWSHQFRVNRTSSYSCLSHQIYSSSRYQSSNVASSSSSSPDLTPPGPANMNNLGPSSTTSDVINQSSGNNLSFASNVDPSLVSQSVGSAESINNVELSSTASEMSSQFSDTALSVASNLEPSLVSQGLGGWGPVGMLQHCLEYAHTGLNLPWWLTIVIGTIIVKTLMFPLVIVAQRNAAHMNNNLPQMQVLQMKMSNARNSGNMLEASRYAHEMSIFMKEREINPLKSMLVPLVQAPVFISFFFALRGMANLPIESFKTGGLFWFENLTVADPYYLLPLITSVTLFITIEVGAEGGMRVDNMQLMRYFLRAMPIIVFPFAINFPAAVLCYWVTSNAFSLCQVSVLKFEPIRRYLNIPKLKKHNVESLPVKKKGFVEGVKDAFTNIKVTRELEERRHLDNIRFTKAGMGPIQKTYPYDPTKQSASSVQAKKPDGH